MRSRYTYSAALRPGRQSAFRPLRRALYGPISTAWGPCRTRLIAPRAPSSCSSGPLTCCTQSHTAWFARFALLRDARLRNADKSTKQTPTDEHSAPIVRKPSLSASYWQCAASPSSSGRSMRLLRSAESEKCRTSARHCHPKESPNATTTADRAASRYRLSVAASSRRGSAIRNCSEHADSPAGTPQQSIARPCTVI